MGNYYIKDSGVCYAKKPDGFISAVLFLSSRKLYLPFRVYKFPKYTLFTYNLSGCAFRRCKFPTITCNKCCFNY